MNIAPSVLADRLRRRWIEGLPQAVGVGEELLSRYADQTRVYHDLRHLSEVLSGVDILRSQSADAQTVELAAWFHDAVYDVDRSDNEVASAELARSLLSPYLEVTTIDEVVRLVVLTRDHAVVSGDSNGAVLCDADLAVLAGSPDAYDEYACRIRREFARVPDAAFRVGRAEVLRGLLALPSLFHTAYGIERWEDTARDNLRRELATLVV